MYSSLLTTLFLFLLWLNGFTSFCQTSKFSHFNAGCGVININYDGYSLEQVNNTTLKSTPIHGNILPLAAYFDWNFAVIKVKELASVGINPGITITGDPLGFSVPVFINYKYGADAQRKNYGTRLGFTIGLGYQASGYSAEDFDYISMQPVYMAEFCIRANSFLVHKLRFMGTVGGFHSYNQSKGEGIRGTDLNVNRYMGLFYLINF